MKANLEPLLHPPDGSMVSKRVRLPSFNHPYHFHPEIEITFIAESNGTRVVGDHIGSFQPGELYLLGANLPHVFRSTVPPERRAEAEVLHFLRGPKPGFLESLPEMKAFAQLLARSKAGLLFDQQTSAQGGRLLRRIRQRNGARRLAAFFELAGTLLEAPEPRVLASAGGSISSRQTTGSERIHRVCNVILKKFTEDLSHREMAKLAHMAPASFSRLFLRTTRKTFTQFVTEVRLGHACRLLRESDNTIADIAFASGFSNLAHFNRQFRHYHHSSPREYRAAFSSATQ
ncbi:MAG: AraC family transcriptional regulator [Verrucomicrobiota bacterium]